MTSTTAPRTTNDRPGCSRKNRRPYHGLTAERICGSRAISMIPRAAMLVNQTNITQPNTPPTRAVPNRCTANSAARMTKASGTTKRQNAALAAVVGAEDERDVLHADDEDQRPDDQRQHAVDVDDVRHEPVVGLEALLDRVKRAGADVAVDDAERGEGEDGETPAARTCLRVMPHGRDGARPGHAERRVARRGGADRRITAPGARLAGAVAAPGRTRGTRGTCASTRGGARVGGRLAIRGLGWRGRSSWFSAHSGWQSGPR